LQEVAPDARATFARRGQSLAHGLPHPVACERCGRVVGPAAAVPFRRRSRADPIHRAPEARGRHPMIALIGDGANRASRARRRSPDWRLGAVLREVGMKPGCRFEVARLQRALDHAPAPPCRA
jgi:L-amino acid N-acyltransferase YncA